MATATLSNRWLLALLLLVAELIALLFVGLVIQALDYSTLGGVFAKFGMVLATAPIAAFINQATTQRQLGSPRAFALTTLGLAGMLLLAFFFVRFTAQGY